MTRLLLFKNTQETLSFGESAIPQQREALQFSRESRQKPATELKQPVLQAALDAVTQAQFCRKTLTIGETK